MSTYWLASVLFCFFSASLHIELKGPAFRPFSRALFFIPGYSRAALSITEREQRRRVLARRCKRRFVATLAMSFRRGRKPGGCEADTKGRANTWLEELSLTRQKAAAPSVTLHGADSPNSVSADKVGNISKLNFSQFWGVQTGTLAHFFFFR